MAIPRRSAASAGQPATALDDALGALDRGEYERAARLLSAVRFDRREERVAAAHLRARALLALDRPGDVAPIVQRAAKELKGADETVVSNMLLGAALTRSGRRPQGEALLEEAAAAAKRHAPRLAAEIAYYRALSSWSAHRLAEAEEIVDAALPAATDVGRSRLLQLLGWIEVRRENYGAAARQFTAALDEVKRAKHPDVTGRSHILHALGIIAAETIDLRLGRLVRREYEACTWSEDTRIERFRVLEYLSWLSLLEGDVSRAWDERQLGLTLTVDSSYHAIALTDAAVVAGIVGDRFSEARYLELAGALLLRGDQVGLDVERRIAMLAYAAAPSAKAATAREVLTLYDRTSSRRTEMLSLEGDRRVEAYELYARGRVALAEGARQPALADLDRALDLWTRLGYRLRVAITANALRAATGERTYAQTGLDALRNAPQAWLRETLERRTRDNDPLGELTAAQRRVLAELCKGKKSREIAAGFGRSFNTINNHTRAVFAAFGVRNRAALVAECARLGILDEVQSAR